MTNVLSPFIFSIVNRSVPINTVLPAISGTPSDGNTLTSSSGIWTGTPTFVYQWWSATDGIPFSGRTGTTFTIGGADVGQSVFCRVTATNAFGSTAADTNTVVITS